MKNQPGVKTIGPMHTSTFNGGLSKCLWKICFILTFGRRGVNPYNVRMMLIFSRNTGSLDKPLMLKMLVIADENCAITIV